jgi:hypothetical protein
MQALDCGGRLAFVSLSAVDDLLQKLYFVLQLGDCFVEFVDAQLYSH